MEVARRDLLGVPIALTDYSGAMDMMDDMIARNDRGYVCAVPVHGVMVAQHDPELLRSLHGANVLNVPDGKPLVWALNLLGEDLPDRVYGPELTDRYCSRAAERGHRVWLYGGHTPEALDQLAEALERRHPGIVIAGRWSPPHRPLTTDEEQEVAERINADRPDVVWVGIGVPKQEKWMARMRDRLSAPVLVGVGAAFDFHAGLVAQAPAWVQRAGLEWAYRLVHEPRRLWRRYAHYNPRFVIGFARQYFRARRTF